MTSAKDKVQSAKLLVHFELAFHFELSTLNLVYA